MNEQETLRLKSLELAVQHLEKDTQNLEPVFQWANAFYKWLTNVAVVKPKPSIPAVTIAPETPYGSKDMVSKKDLGELLIAMQCNNYGRKQALTQAQIIGYNDAINDLLDIIDKL